MSVELKFPVVAHHRIIVNAADESVLTDGKPDTDKIKPLTFDPLKHVYRGLTAPVAKAFQG